MSDIPGADVSRQDAFSIKAGNEENALTAFDRWKKKDIMNPKGAPKCPKCGDRSRIICLGKRYAVYPVGCLLIAGLPFAMLHQSSSPTDYECRTCGEKFSVRSFMAKLCLGMIYLFIALLIGAIAFAVINP